MEGVISSENRVEDAVPTADIALNSMRIVAGIYFAGDATRAVTADQVAERFGSRALDL